VTHRSLLKTNAHFFSLTIMNIFFSAPGQTFLIALIIPYACDSLSMSSFTFASIYSVSTLSASLLLPFIGRLIDQKPAAHAIWLIGGGFGSAIALFSASASVWQLGLALFFMRLLGQGALALFASSHTIKRFEDHRGAALSITQLGYPLSEFIFPTLVIFSLSIIGWRHTFIVLACGVFFVYLPLALWLSRSITRPLDQPMGIKKGPHHPLQMVLKDPFFPIYIGLSCISPIMMTATLYFQMHIFSTHAWAISGIGQAMFFYALFKLIFTLGIGPLIDKIGCLIPIFLINAMIGVATLCISIPGPLYLGFLSYAFFGMSLGASASTMSYMWARLYGHQHIGEIKGGIAIIRNGATAIAPIGFSIFIYQWNIPFQSVFLWCAIGIIGFSTTALFIHRFDPRLTPS
jgi:MFS family permease